MTPRKPSTLARCWRRHVRRTWRIGQEAREKGHHRDLARVVLILVAVAAGVRRAKPSDRTGEFPRCNGGRVGVATGGGEFSFGHAAGWCGEGWRTQTAKAQASQAVVSTSLYASLYS
jgi:hypothetical protein